MSGTPESPLETAATPRRVRRGVTALVLLGLLLMVLAVTALLQTSSGQALVLEAALGRVRASLAGELRVAGIRSGTLLTGASLVEVELTDAEGRRVLAADSVVVRYLPTGLLGGPPRLRSLVLWGADLVVARYDPDRPLNVEEVLEPGDPEPGAAGDGAGRTFLSTHVGFRESTVSVLLPPGRTVRAREAGAEDPRSVAGPTGPLQRIAFEDLHLDLDDVALRLQAQEVLSADLAGMRARAWLPVPGREPLVVHEVFGRVRVGRDGVRIEDGLFRLPGTLLEGSLDFAPVEGAEGWAILAELDSRDWGELDDLRWLDARVPSGSFRGGARLRVHDGVDVALDDVRARLPASDLALDGTARMARDGGLRLGSMAVVMTPLALDRLEPWLDRELPLDGWLSGRLMLSGALEDLDVDGRVTLVPVGHGGTPTTADLRGRMHFGARLGWTDFAARLSPVNWRLAQVLAPDLPIDGTGSASVQLDGRADGRVRLIAEVEHVPAPGVSSRVYARGSVDRTGGGDWSLDLSGDLQALDLASVASWMPDLELTGSLRGPVRLSGTLGALAFETSLDTDGGRVALTGALDVRDPAAGYSLRGESRRLALSALSTRFPEPTEWSGRFELEGRGFVVDSLAASAVVDIVDARVGRLVLDSLAAVVRAEDGMLVAHDVHAVAPGARIEGSGSVGLRADRMGTASISFAADSLGWLRPALMGDSILVRDHLSTLQLELLRLDGVDPDTLPTALDVRLEGRVDGVGRVTGNVRSLGLALDGTLSDGAYRGDELDSLRLSLRASALGSSRNLWEVDGRARGIRWGGRSFGEASLTGSMLGRAGEGALRLARADEEEYTLVGGFVLDSSGGSADLLEARARIEDQTWFLVRPAGVRWTTGTLSVDGVEVRREGPDPMRLTASGAIRRGGSSDFELVAEGLHLDRVGVVTQTRLDLEGHADLNVRVEGPAEAPRIRASFEVIDPRFGTMRLSRLAGSLEYENLLSTVRVRAWEGDRVALDGGGTVPVDLTLREVEDRRVDRPMELSIEADSLDAALALAYFQTLRDIEGTVSASIEVRGTLRDPTPAGAVRLENASWTVDALGVRHRSVSGELRLTPDRNVEVELAALGQGRSEVTGTVALSPLSDPTIDLDISFAGFRAMQRRDMEGVITGAVHLGGTYRRPLVQGAVTVDGGTLFIEEFSRSAGVVDLADPRLFGEGLAVDTTVFVAQPILADVRNPFLDNLRLDVDLSVPRNVWLRSNQMNVEMGGELLVRYDRTEGDLVLVGELQALRGTYRVASRTFDVEEGVVSFIGTPGVNPALAITTRARVRTPDEPVDVIATVEGTLVQPMVTLTSEDGVLSQSDLISYMVFNRPASDLGQQQQSVLGDVTRTGLGIAVGAFASQFTGTLAQNIGFDYLSLSSAGAMEYTTAQVEVGRYVTDDLFVVFVFRPLSTPEVSRFGGVRVEWALTDAYNVEAFREDRFLRSGTGVFGLPELGGQQIYGIFLFREWGFN